MDIEQFYGNDPNEQPLDRMVAGGGFCGIFRTIGCVGDSLSSGVFETLSEEDVPGHQHMYDYSWGQYLARMAGCTVRSFSRGGMTAKEFCESFGERCGCWDDDNLCQAYILALGVNDGINPDFITSGSMEDVCAEDWHKNAPTFVGYYAQIIQRIKEKQPYARFFLVTIPREDYDEPREALKRAHADLVRGVAALFDNTYVIDLNRYGPVYDGEFRAHFFMGGHMNPSGYLLTARMMASYIDYIIRHNYADFKQPCFIGTPYYFKYDKR